MGKIKKVLISGYIKLHDYLEGLNNFWNLFYAPQAPGLVAPFEE